jgi:hypothetical protein
MFMKWVKKKQNSDNPLSCVFVFGAAGWAEQSIKRSAEQGADTSLRQWHKSEAGTQVWGGDTSLRRW